MPMQQKLIHYTTVHKGIHKGVIMSNNFKLYLFFFSYLFTIYLANLLIIYIGFVSVGFGLTAPAGVYAAGLAFSLRDGLQEYGSKRYVIIAIILGSILSFFLNAELALASASAFLVSELLDYAVYTPIKKYSIIIAVLLSNTVGAFVDSAIFLSLAFGSLEFIYGQFFGKMWITLVTVVLMLAYKYIRNRKTIL